MPSSSTWSATTAPMHQVLAARPKDIAVEFAWGSAGMTDAPVTIDEINAARDQPAAFARTARLASEVFLIATIPIANAAIGMMARSVLIPTPSPVTVVKFASTR